ncbi:craniofacial development protein 2-like [Sipha flava]|jgi:endonuclease/exonuclease/phosphatase family metal-dependent hydrolase|uniref:Craniofacial development protein 2-like n=2 Tax=Sipha flava TaxID=143950 RepID=A0A8B8FYU3_9HEMI|nr:craniofacial development protein 2-like [Sipha flava]
MKCVALQEIRWEDTGKTKVSQTTIFNGKYEHPHKLGTGFAIHESIIHTAKEFKDINPRISTITIKSKNLDMILINAHALTEEKDEDEKDLFYATLADVFASSTGIIKVVLGDFNAKLDRDICYKKVVGNHSLYESTNDNGVKLIDFEIENGLVIKSTMLPKKDIHKYTRGSLDGKYKNQIDYVLVNSRFKNSILNIRTRRGANIGSDHLLLGIE